jgi:hypothetical protein
MPETENLRRRLFAEENGRDAFFGDDFKAPGAADEREQRPHHTRNYGQDEALDESESLIPRSQNRDLGHPALIGIIGHSFDFNVSSQNADPSTPLRSAQE